MNKLLAIPLSLTLILLSLSCSSLTKSISQNDFGLILVTQYATLKYVESEDGKIDRTKAKMTYDYAENVKSALSIYTLVTTEQLKDYIYNSVDWSSMSPTDALATKAFVNFLALELDNKLEPKEGSGLDPTNDVEIAAHFLIKTVMETLEPYV